MEFNMNDLKSFVASGFSDEMLAQAYRAMIPNHITYIKDKQGDREYIDLAVNIFRGMPEEVKQQYSELLTVIMEKKNITTMTPGFWQTIHSVNPMEVEPQLCEELTGVFNIVQNVVDEAQQIRGTQGRQPFSITEEEIATSMGVENLDEMLGAVYYPRTELVQKYYDIQVSRYGNTFGTQPLVQSTNGIKR